MSGSENLITKNLILTHLMFEIILFQVFGLSHESYSRNIFLGNLFEFAFTFFFHGLSSNMNLFQFSFEILFQLRLVIKNYIPIANSPKQGNHGDLDLSSHYPQDYYALGYVWVKGIVRRNGKVIMDLHDSYVWNKLE